MNKYTTEEREAALLVISSVIRKCEKVQPKFVEGTSQHSLLKNRIKALYLSRSLITENNAAQHYTQEELTDALPPVISIISKCEKAQLAFAEGTFQYINLQNIIKAMDLTKSFIADGIDQKEL